MSSIEVGNLCVLTAKVSQAVLILEKSLVQVIRLQLVVNQIKWLPSSLKSKNRRTRKYDSPYIE
jgi:hypothetical protein